MSRELVKGKEYYQKSCKVWLTYAGIDKDDPRFHNFKKGCTVYNQLFDNELEMMFDFDKVKIINPIKLIAEFMGVKMSEELCKGSPTFVGGDLIKAGLPFKTIMGNCIDNPPFDKSWDWLMPVVLKINTMEDERYTVIIKSMDAEILDNKTNTIICECTCENTCDELIKSVYSVVVEFINSHCRKLNI